MTRPPPDPAPGSSGHLKLPDHPAWLRWLERTLWVVPFIAFLGWGWAAFGVTLGATLLVYFLLVVCVTPPAIDVKPIERLYKTVARTRGLVCPKCERELPESLPAGTCPGCGERCSIAQVRLHWGFDPAGRYVGAGEHERWLRRRIDPHHP